MPFAHKRFGGNCNITHCCKTLHKTTAKFSSNPRISFLRKSTRKDPPVKSDQNKAMSVHVLWRSFRHRSTPVLCSSHQKINFLHYISVTAVKCTIVPVQRKIFRRQKNPRRGYRPRKVNTILCPRERMYCQTIRTVRDLSRDDRARIATCSLRTPTDRQTYRLKENYYRWRLCSVLYFLQMCTALLENLISLFLHRYLQKNGT